MYFNWFTEAQDFSLNNTVRFLALSINNSSIVCPAHGTLKLPDVAELMSAFTRDDTRNAVNSVAWRWLVFNGFKTMKIHRFTLLERHVK